MSKIITVFGATGNQGGSVIKHILADSVLSKEFKIRGVTRDVTNPRAKSIANQGVQMVSADLNSKSSVAEAIKGSHTVFLVTNYWETATPGVERQQGINVADAAKEASVLHLIYSSLLNVNKVTGGRLKHVVHFDEKAEIEEYIRTTGVPSTFFLPAYFMANYTMMLRKGEDGSYVLAYPISGDSRIPLIDAAEDTGKWVKAIIKNRDAVLGKQILAATDYYTPKQIVAEFEATTGKKASYYQVTTEQYVAALPPSAAKEYLENHLFIESPGYYNGKALDESHAILEDKLTTWQEFIKKTPAFSE